MPASERGVRARERETETLDEVSPMQIVSLFFSSSYNLLISASLHSCLLMLAKGLTPRSLQVACQAAFGLFEGKRILVRAYLYLRFELL
jgi:hypothetical protein